MPFLLPPLARGEGRRAPLHLARERERGAPHLGEGPRALDAHEHVHAARARRLRPSDETEISQRRLHHSRDLPHLRPRHARDRIEVDAQLVGVIEIVGAHRMRVQLEAGEVRHPRERRRVARHDFFGGAPGGEAAATRPRSRADAIPARASGRRTLRRCRLDSGRARWAGRRAPQRAFGHRQVIANEIELRVARVRKQHFARVGDRDLAPRGDHGFLFGLRHTSE